MKIFVTGATGFIGSALVPELLQAEHQVLGLIRSGVGAVVLRKAGAQARHGNLEGLDNLRREEPGDAEVKHGLFKPRECYKTRLRINVSKIGGPGRVLTHF